MAVRRTSATSGSQVRASQSGDGSQPLSPGQSSRASSRTVLSDKYLLGEELGRGAYGQVFKGVDSRTGACVAIKQLSLDGISNDNLASIQGEIDLLKNLNHKNIVKYIGSFKTRTHLYIILEYMENGALSSVIKPTKFGAFPESLVAVYIAQVLQGLAYLHDQGVVHRDIKGANILTTKEGLVKLADFGVAAKLTEVEDENDSLRLSVVGTPYWMAPEVIEMTSVTAASDIWSVACLAIELLTGQPPYYDLQPMSALFRIVQDERPTLPEDISADFTDFLIQCFQKDPQRRPNARQLLKHRWISYNRQTLRTSWSRTQGIKARGGRTDAHVSVSTVVERMLQAEADEFAASAAAAAGGKPMPVQQEPVAKAPAQTPMNQSRPASLKRVDAPDAQLAAATREGSGEFAPSATTQELPGADSLRTGFATPEQDNGAGIVDEVRPIPNPARMQDYSSAVEQSAAPGLLGQLGTHSRQQQDSRDDLLAWLDEKERTSSPPILPAMDKLAREAGHPEDVVDGAVSKHQEAAEVRRLVSALHAPIERIEVDTKDPEKVAKMLNTKAAREAGAVEAARQLIALFQQIGERRDVFVTEDGAVVILELLESNDCDKVGLAALELLNVLVAEDLHVLGTTCLLGMIPAVAKYAASVGPITGQLSGAMRLQAAFFLQHLTRTNLATAQLLIACQGLHVLVGLVEDNFAENGQLVHIGVGCIWRLLELHGPISLNHICRLLVTAGLAHNLVCALASASRHHRTLPDYRKSFGGPAKISRKPSADGVKAESQMSERAASHAQASSRDLKEERIVVGSNSNSASKKGLQNMARPESWTEISTAIGLQTLLEQMGNLLLVLSHADTAVKAMLCHPDTLRVLFVAIDYSGEPLQLMTLRCIKNLSTDPSMLDPLKVAHGIPSLVRYLQPNTSVAVQLEAMSAMHNLCKISRLRQEEASKAELVPYLAGLAKTAPEYDTPQAMLRQMAVSLLCGMAHASHNTRNKLWANNGLQILLELLEEPDWQSPALDALATWLTEDPGRIEPRLTLRDPVERFVKLFASYSGTGGSDALAGLLEPFLRILRRSPQITVEVAVAGLAGLVVELLRTATALTALNLLQMVKVIYEHHPRPKEFVAKYAIADQLRRLAAGDRNNQSVLVRKQATHLLHAFQINSIF